MENNRIQFLFKLYILARKVKGHYKNKNTDEMLKATILHTLSESGCTVSSLADKLYTKISSISEKVIDLEKEGLITKKKLLDGRESNLELTQKGIKRLEGLVSMMKEHCTKMTNHLSDQEINKGIHIIQKMTTA